MSVRARDAPGVSWGYPKSSRLKTYPFEPGVPMFWYKLVVEVPVPVPVEATTPELPGDLQNIAVVTSVARPVVFIAYTSYSFRIWRNNGFYRSGCGR